MKPTVERKGAGTALRAPGRSPARDRTHSSGQRSASRTPRANSACAPRTSCTGSPCTADERIVTFGNCAKGSPQARRCAPRAARARLAASWRKPSACCASCTRAHRPSNLVENPHLRAPRVVHAQRKANERAYFVDAAFSRAD